MELSKKGCYQLNVNGTTLTDDELGFLMLWLISLFVIYMDRSKLTERKLAKQKVPLNCGMEEKKCVTIWKKLNRDNKELEGSQQSIVQTDSIFILQ